MNRNWKRDFLGRECMNCGVGDHDRTFASRHCCCSCDRQRHRQGSCPICARPLYKGSRHAQRPTCRLCGPAFREGRKLGVEWWQDYYRKANPTKARIPRAPRNRPEKFQPWEIEKMCQIYMEGTPLAEVGRVFDTSRRVVAGILCRHGVQIRGRGRPRKREKLIGFNG